MPQENYELSVYNTVTGQAEDIKVSEAIYNEYRRGGWRIDYSDQHFGEHETVFSDLLGNWEHFREFLSEADNPAFLAEEHSAQRQLRIALDLLDEADHSLLLDILIRGKTEREVAAEQGVSQNVIHRKKRRIVNFLKTFLF